MNALWQLPSRLTDQHPGCLTTPMDHLPHPAIQTTHRDLEMSGKPATISFGEFVHYKFVPDCVAVKKAAARTHYRAILKYVLSPELVAQSLGMGARAYRKRLQENSGVTYMDSLALNEITPDVIQRFMASYLELGYSGQTVAHIRNLLRAIFSYAAVTGSFVGANPAALVTAPEIVRKQVNSLSLTQLQKTLQSMHYPEKEIALFVLLTGLNVTEVCGLQWKYVNLSIAGRPIDGEWLRPRTISIRTESYRGVVGPVNPRRKRLINVCSLLNLLLRDLLRRQNVTAPEDFVLRSRSGTPINPDNIARRRLKPIGTALGMPWLSWKVFRRTRTNLVAELGKQWSEEIAQALPSRRP